jgi:hypothetical protein
MASFTKASYILFSSLLFVIVSTFGYFLLISRNALCYNLNLSPVSLSLSLSLLVSIFSVHKKKAKAKKALKRKETFF